MSNDDHNRHITEQGLAHDLREQVKERGHYPISSPAHPAPSGTPTPTTFVYDSAGQLYEADLVDGFRYRTLETELTAAQTCIATASRDALIMRDDFLKRIAALEGELATLKTELETTKDGIAHFERLAMEPGKMEAEIKQHPALRELIAKTFAHIVADAPNYTEMKFDLRGCEQWITVTVQKAEGKTPHQKRIEAEQDRNQLRAENAELRATVAAWNEMYSNGPTFREINAARAALAQGGGE